jgi:hypothetical protein
MKAWQKTLMALGSVIAPGMAVAGEAAVPHADSFSLSQTTPSVQLQEIAEVPSRISGFVGMTVTNAYISRFMLLENQGLIFQPYAELDFALFEEKAGFVKSAYIFGGVWNSLHTHNEVGSTTGELGGWYEFDWYVGASATLEGGFTVDLQYAEFLSPGQAFGSAKNLILNVAFDDSPYLGRYGMNPYAQVLYETSGKVGSGADDGGIYLELGINPGITLMEGGDYPVTVSVPAAIGFGFNDFYGDNEGGNNDDELFGGFRIGLAAGVPLTFMNQSGYGAWALSGDITWWYYGDGADGYNKNGVGNGDDSDLALTLGVQCNF